MLSVLSQQLGTEPTRGRNEHKYWKIKRIQLQQDGDVCVTTDVFQYTAPAESVQVRSAFKTYICSVPEPAIKDASGKLDCLMFAVSIQC